MMIDVGKAPVNRLRNFSRTYMRRRYSILFYSLLLTLVAVPVLGALRSNGILIDSLLAANLLVALMPVGIQKNRSLLLSFMVVLWLARVLAVWSDQRVLSLVTLVIWTIIGLLAATAAL